ncbi:hypothetical protein Aspvir_005598 [Aspergillus viridinutans]|uniref:WKF domain-containing protein n=1 Tax=Aspergillus viridinutans TaxID=75553 RepID=A0A9P3BSN4_ASPVI|nr:uncharacterized protein Aspvir_005598 [Aspergillus viridinutans]GIK01560.1 hypothetical protein Aspvir_005598 [Aspergillus viridinutans]
MSSEKSEESSHLSASKKAGRKLKHANDTPAVENGETEKVDKKDKKTKDKKKKGKSSDGRGTEDAAVTTDMGEKKQKQKEKKSKKRRLDDENDGEEKAVAEPESESQQRRKKKRVSFSADTVMRDGEESESESRPEVKNGDAEAVQAPLATEEQVDADDEGEKKKKKKEKKKKKKDQSVTTASDSTPTSHESPVLSYLNLYHNHRSAWKFQKNRETHLFKHIMSLEHVPAKYNAALLSYLKGLKSEGAKQRLQQVAEEVVKAEMEEDLVKEQATETEDKTESDMTGYNKVVEAFRTRLSQGGDDFDEIEIPDSLDGERLAKLQRRQRAELVLFAVSGKLFYLEKTKAKRGPSTQAPPARKKKKNRTAFVEISSSSESESSSDSDSEKKPKKAAKPKKDSSSESSSTDSSSDSDDNGSHKEKATGKKEASSSESSNDSSTDSRSDSDSDSN